MGQKYQFPLFSTDDTNQDGQTIVKEKLSLKIPPMYSALKRDGQPLYKLARQGIEVEREPRAVTIFETHCIAFCPGEYPTVKIYVRCSKGTYIRSLVEDLGRDLGVGAHVVNLRRVESGHYGLAQAITLESLESERGDGLAEVLDHHLLAVDSPIESIPRITLTDESGYYFKQGQAVMDIQVYQLGDCNDTLRVYTESEEFLGVGMITDEGSITPKRLVIMTPTEKN